VTEHFAWA